VSPGLMSAQLSCSGARNEKESGDVSDFMRGPRRVRCGVEVDGGLRDSEPPPFLFPHSSREVRGMYGPPEPCVMRSKISSGRSGISVNEIPVACWMALRMAGAGPSMGSSPMPLAPPGPWMDGTSSK